MFHSLFHHVKFPINVRVSSLTAPSVHGDSARPMATINPLFPNVFLPAVILLPAPDSSPFRLIIIHSVLQIYIRVYNFLIGQILLRESRLFFSSPIFTNRGSGADLIFHRRGELGVLCTRRINKTVQTEST